MSGIFGISVHEFCVWSHPKEALAVGGVSQQKSPVVAQVAEFKPMQAPSKG
jgi:hypothetical protein